MGHVVHLNHLLLRDRLIIKMFPSFFPLDLCFLFFASFDSGMRRTPHVEDNHYPERIKKKRVRFSERCEKVSLLSTSSHAVSFSFTGFFDSRSKRAFQTPPYYIPTQHSTSAEVKHSRCDSQLGAFLLFSFCGRPTPTRSPRCFCDLTLWSTDVD